MQIQVLNLIVLSSWDDFRAELAEEHDQFDAADQRGADTDAHRSADAADDRIEAHRVHLSDARLLQLPEVDLELGEPHSFFPGRILDFRQTQTSVVGLEFACWLTSLVAFGEKLKRLAFRTAIFKAQQC